MIANLLGLTLLNSFIVKSAGKMPENLLLPGK